MNIMLEIIPYDLSKLNIWMSISSHMPSTGCPYQYVVLAITTKLVVCPVLEIKYLQGASIATSRGP